VQGGTNGRTDSRWRSPGSFFTRWYLALSRRRMPA